MEKFLIFIKHNLKIIWRVIDWFNCILFSQFYEKRLNKILPVVFSQIEDKNYLFRQLNKTDIDSLLLMINSQSSEDLKFFNPHRFDKPTIDRQIRNPSFLMMGVFTGEKLIGYFFLRFFVNKACFVGRLIDKDFRGKGIGPVMNRIMYEITWKMDFRCLSTISKNNKAVMGAHAKNRSMVILKELSDNYILVEFIKA